MSILIINAHWWRFLDDANSCSLSSINCLHGWGVKKLIQSAHTDATKNALKDDILILNREKDFLEFDSWNENLYLLNVLFDDM